MKPLQYDTDGHYKPIAKGRGKGFPRHLYKNTNLAVNEDEAVSVSYGYEGNRYVGEPTRMSMNRSYGELAEYGCHNSPYVKWSYLKRWLRSHIGENIDTVYTEFLTAWNLQSSLRKSHCSVQDEFWKAIYSDNRYEKTTKAYHNDVRHFPFKVDKENRLQVNPNYRPWSWKKPAIYDQMFVRDNKAVLEPFEASFRPRVGSWAHHNNAFGPIGIGKRLWVVHPDTGMPVKVPVSLVRTCIFDKNFKKSDNYYYGSEVVPTERLSTAKLEWLRSEFRPVAVIRTVSEAEKQLKVQVDRPMPAPSWSKDYKTFTFVTPKSFL